MAEYGGDRLPQYNDTNRAFLQAFLARGTLTFDEAKPVLASIFTAKEGDREILPGDVTEADFSSYIHAANDAISKFDLAIRSTLSQHDRMRIYALVNTTSDLITQLSTTYTADEIAYLKRLLDAMFETYNTQRQEVMALTSMQAVRLHKVPDGSATPVAGASQSSGGQLTMIGAERMLKNLVHEGWFEESRSGFYSLSPRALIELRQYLLDTYNDPSEEGDDGGREAEHLKIKFCSACKELVTVVGATPKHILH
ncbi:MAG: hypothetical protein M1833_001203 [Piccolia ochrophora]|nr:MAG: hypothetical protein M1833_001203 [Piccolia ochrophora]